MKTREGQTRRSYTLSAELKPILRVNPGESFVFETEDAVSGALKSEKDLFSAENLEPFSLRTPELANPVNGPIFVEGVEKGDLLAVHIEAIIPNEYGLTGVKVNQGMFSDSKKWSTIHREAYTKFLRHTNGASGTTKDGEVVFSESLSWHTEPFIGTIGVAPEVEVLATSVTQGPWGGNWDCRYICPQSTIYINAFHPGGLLFVGDVHGSQGDGEISGIANEIRAEVQLRVDVIKKKRIAYPRIETNKYLVTFCASKPLEHAIELATDYLLEWVRELYNIDLRILYMVFGACPEFKIDVYQMVQSLDLSYTAGVRFPREYLRRLAADASG
jgi:amidase